MTDRSERLAPDGKSLGKRVWADGCYDMVHFGHANMLRQSKLFGEKLVVGVHSDEEIAIHKGPPVFNEQERYRMVKGIKWVDEVVKDAPYSTTVATLDKYSCDFCVHGNDITLTADGHDTYEEVKAAGRYRECQRTEGVSTTDLVGRMLLLTKAHHERDESMIEHSERARSLSTDSVAAAPYNQVSYYTTTSTLNLFSAGRQPKPTDKIVYVCGAFDLFHIGHLAFLEEAAKLGDYLIVGILSDQVVNSYKGHNHPIMSLHERVLCVLAYRPVNEVIIGAPFNIDDALLDRFNVSVVAQGTRVPYPDFFGEDPFLAPKKRGIFVNVDSNNDMTTDKIIGRILENRATYLARNEKKAQKEEATQMVLKKLNGDTKQAVVLDNN